MALILENILVNSDVIKCKKYGMINMTKMPIVTKMTTNKTRKSINMVLPLEIVNY